MDLNKMRCKKCKYYRNIYIHPWSENIPEELKGSKIGFACILPNDVDFIESFNKRKANRNDLRIDVTIGKDDTIGCENFDEDITFHEGRRCQNCKNYVFVKGDDWPDKCNHEEYGLFECDPYEAECCNNYEDK